MSRYTQQPKADILQRHPGAVRDLQNAEGISGVGDIITPSPAAMTVNAKAAVREARVAAGKKLTHALYYRKTKGILTPRHKFFTSTYQI